MNKPVVLIVPESNVDVIKEISDLLKDVKNNILIKLIDDDSFNVMFNIDCDTVDIDMSDETFLKIARMAHEDDITFNQMIVKMLRSQIEKEVHDQ
jgi:hypothetical protein